MIHLKRRFTNGVCLVLCSQLALAQQSSWTPERPCIGDNDASCQISNDAGNASFEKITRLLSLDSSRDRRIVTESESTPTGYRSESSWLILNISDSNSTAAPLYRCGFGNGGTTLSRIRNCPGMNPLGLIGYVYTDAAPGRVALRRCGLGEFVSDFPNCEGSAYREQEFLGYAYRSLPYDVSVSASPSIVARGDPVEISWQTSRILAGHNKRIDKFPNRTIGLTLSPAGVSGAFIEEGHVTGAPKSNRFPTVYPTTGTTLWKTRCDLAGWCGKLIAGEYQVQAVLFPACVSRPDPELPCNYELQDFLFTSSNVFTIVDPTAPDNLTGSCNGEGAALFRWDAPPAKPVGYFLRIQDVGSEHITASKDDIFGTSHATTLVGGHTYTWWVHAQYESGASPRSAAQITCR